MTVHENTKSFQGPPAAQATLSRSPDTDAAHETSLGPLERATPVAISPETGVYIPRRPHPCPLVWVDMSAEVCALGRGGETVRQIATALGLTKSQVEDALDRGGVRRLHAAPVAVGRRTFDRAAVITARKQGVSVRDLADRFGVSPQSIRLAVKQGAAS